MSLLIASMKGFTTYVWKLFQAVDTSPTTKPTAALINHFPRLTKNAPTATAAFHARSAHPATVFQNSCHAEGGGGGMLQFPPFTTDVFAARLFTSARNPRV